MVWCNLRVRVPVLDVEGGGQAFLRLWFKAAPVGLPRGAVREVHLFLSDARDGQGEDCFLFRVRATDEP